MEICFYYICFAFCTWLLNMKVRLYKFFDINLERNEKINPCYLLFTSFFKQFSAKCYYYYYFIVNMKVRLNIFA